MKKNMTAFLLIALLPLAACVSREQADEHLAKGCTAGIEINLKDGNKIKEIKSKSFADSAEEGAGYREVTLNYVESDGWADVDKTGKCIFAEEFGFMKTTHSASIYQIQVNDQTYGKKGGEIIGSYEDIAKMTEAVENAMNGI